MSALRPIAFDAVQWIQTHGIRVNDVLVYHPLMGVIVHLTKQDGTVHRAKLRMGDPAAFLSRHAAALRFRGFIGAGMQSTRAEHRTRHLKLLTEPFLRG